MIKLQAPTQSAKETFKSCVRKVRDPELKSRFSLCEEKISNASEEFRNKASSSELHTILPSDSIEGIVSSEEMQKVYTSRMARKNSPGREYYDSLMAIPRHGRCPLCGQRTVSTLDHYLPKAHFPALVVAPLNLVPSCKDCNTVKTDGVPSCSEEETLHPYFDDIEGEIWLKAKMIEGDPISLLYYADPPSSWSEVLSKRVLNHFSVFKLSQLYASHSAEELINIETINRRIFKNGGADSLREFLNENLQSHRNSRLNSWSSALYHALAYSDHYCNEHFSI